MNMFGPLKGNSTKGGAPAGNEPGGDQNLFSLLRDGGGAEREVPILRQYLRMLVRRKWILMGSMFAACLLGLLITLLATPYYTATTRIEIARAADRIVQVQEVQRESTVADLEFYQTQYGLLKSRSLAERVVSDLRLQDSRPFFALFGATPTTADGFAPANRDARVRTAASLLLAHITINPTRGSSLVDVSFESPDPQLSAQVANSWARNFIQGNLDRRFQATAYARQFLEQRLAQLRQRLEESERQSVGYAANQGLISVAAPPPPGSGQLGTEQRSLVADELARLNAELASAIAERLRNESRVRPDNGATSNEALASPSLAGLRQRRAEVASQYAQMMTQFEPTYPPAAALHSQLTQLDASISAEEARISRNITSNYQNSRAREQALSQRVEQLKAAFIDQQRRSIQSNIYQRDLDTSRQIYDALLQRYKEIGVAGGVGTNNVTVIDQAQVPGAPSSPKLMLNMLLALILGAMAGVGISLALEHVDEVVSDPTDIPAALNVPTLGTVPVCKEDIQVALMDPKSSITEAYLAIQTSLQFVTAHGFPRTLTITSTAPAEGKSTTSLALARSMARSGRRVVLVDGDMRSPSLHHLFEISNHEGLSNYLAGNDAIESLIRSEIIPNLSVISAGPPPPNAADLLSGERIGMLIDRLSEMFDHVIIDSPPVMGLADAPLIASRVEATAYVVAAHATPLSLIRVALQRMAGSNANLIGVILSKFESARSHYGYGYDYGYSYASTKSDAPSSD